MSRDFKVQLKQKKATDMKKVQIPVVKTQLPSTIPPQLQPKSVKEYVPEVERPNSKDHEGGFTRVTTDDSKIKSQYRELFRTTIDSYLNVLSKKLSSDFSWRISADASMLNIYDEKDKLYQSKKLHLINGDSYYVVFDEPATEKLKAHKALAFVDWFL